MLEMGLVGAMFMILVSDRESTIGHPMLTFIPLTQIIIYEIVTFSVNIIAYVDLEIIYILYWAYFLKMIYEPSRFVTKPVINLSGRLILGYPIQ